MSSPTLPPPAWHPDPEDPTQWRWWDGQQWTEHRAPRDAPPAPIVETVEVVQTVTTVAPVESGGDALVARGFAMRRQRRKQEQQVPTVEDVAAQLELEAPRRPLEEQIEVAGETFYAKGIKRVFAGAGVPILSTGSTLDAVDCVLVPEPWNPHDRNAVAVVIDGHQVGHLPADLAVDYSEPLVELARHRKLATGEARVWALDESGVIRARVTILIPEVEAFD